MNFEDFKEQYFQKNPYLREVDPNGISPQDLTNEIIKTCVEETMDILEEYTKWINKKED